MHSDNNVLGVCVTERTHEALPKADIRQIQRRVHGQIHTATINKEIGEVVPTALVLAQHVNHAPLRPQRIHETDTARRVTVAVIHVVLCLLALDTCLGLLRSIPLKVVGHARVRRRVRRHGRGVDGGRDAQVAVRNEIDYLAAAVRDDGARAAALARTRGDGVRARDVQSKLRSGLVQRGEVAADVVDGGAGLGLHSLDDVVVDAAAAGDGAARHAERGAAANHDKSDEKDAVDDAECDEQAERGAVKAVVSPNGEETCEKSPHEHAEHTQRLVTPHRINKNNLAAVAAQVTLGAERARAQDAEVGLFVGVAACERPARDGAQLSGVHLIGRVGRGVGVRHGLRDGVRQHGHALHVEWVAAVLLLLLLRVRGGLRLGAEADVRVRAAVAHGDLVRGRRLHKKMRAGAAQKGKGRGNRGLRLGAIPLAFLRDVVDVVFAAEVVVHALPVGREVRVVLHGRQRGHRRVLPHDFGHADVARAGRHSRRVAAAVAAAVAVCQRTGRSNAERSTAARARLALHPGRVQRLASTTPPRLAVA